MWTIGVASVLATEVVGQNCRLNDQVQCPHSSVLCQGDMCCPDGSICPSAQMRFVECARGRERVCEDFEATVQSRALSNCNVGDEVQCPSSNAWCKGNECCPNGSVCPSADPSFRECERAKAEDCTMDSANSEFYSASSCSAHAGCAGLSGECCPTTAGVSLDCCGAPPPEASCSAHSACNGLNGDCCPTSGGVMLQCCAMSPTPPPSPYPPSPHPPSPYPPSPPQSGMGFCGVASTVPNKNEGTWGPLFRSAGINWFWNWDIQATSNDYVPEGWYFVPSLWGTGTFPLNSGIVAHDGPGASTYTVTDIALGWNEPDIIGLCVSQPEIATPSDGWCQVAGSMGWWFPDLVNNPLGLMSDWYQQYDDSRNKGYRVTAPQVAYRTDESWLMPFVRASCNSGRCPQLLAWHFYSMGCHDGDSYLQDFANRMDDTLTLMREFPSIEGTMITEAGTLALEQGGGQAASTCPDSVLVSVLRKMFAIMRRSKYYVNGRNIVRHFSWFSQDGTGATYSLSLVDPSTGAMRPLGNAYVEECRAMMASTEVPLNASNLMV